MTSKLQRHKHILALLNSKLEGRELYTELLESPEMQEGDEQSSSPGRLMSQVYQFHKSIIQNINAGLITIDLAGEITFANRSAAELLNTQVEALLGENLVTFFKSGPEGKKFLELCTLPGKKIDDWESKFRHPDREEMIVGINSSYLQDAHNNYEGVVLLLRDLTEIHHLRSQVERMERLALLGELSAGIAHEIRNPLAGIKAATQLLEDSFEKDDFQYQVIYRIIREVDKANRLLKEFFKFARPTKPKLGFHDIHKIIDDVYLLLAPRLKTLRVTYDDRRQQPLPRVYVDETQIEQVVLNLFLNAVDAMKNGGVLRIATQRRQLNILENEQRTYGMPNGDLDYVIVEISDTGPGIAEQHLQKIFNPFFTTKPEGLGLGLSICSRLVEENKGKIDVVSHKGSGTTFILALPTFMH